MIMIKFESLKACQDKYVSNNEICIDSLSFPTGSAVAMQHEDGGLWMHGVIEELGD